MAGKLIATPEATKAPGWSYMLGWVSPAAPPRSDTGEAYTSVVDGHLVASVGLKGPLGRGRRMVLDDADWRRVSLVLGTVWGLRQLDTGGVYVVSKGKASAGPGLPATPVLARYLAKAGRDEVVTYRDGDALHLVRANLEVVGRADFMRRFGTAGQA